MRKFDYSFLKRISVPADIMNYATSIYEMKAKAELRRTDFADVFSAMESVAKIQSVKSSNAIEGIITTDKRIRDIVNKSTAPQGHNELEIAGYRDALDLIHGSYSDIPFSEKSILQLHRMLLRPSGDDLAGRYKTEDNFIMETDREGVRSVRFTPIPANETASAMEQLILAYHAAYSESEINPLLLIPCVILDFLCIHPFNDGNGRMSRLLTTLLLYRSGFYVGKYISLEAKIAGNKELYYESLGKAQAGWHEGTEDAIPFIKYLLGTILAAYKDFEERFAIVEEKLPAIEMVRKAILLKIGKFTKQDIMELCPTLSISSVEGALRKLVKEGDIGRGGTGKSTYYVRMK